MSDLWRGVLPAITTPFDSSGEVDHAFLEDHTGWLTQNGCSGIVALGSLGEGGTLSHSEKVKVLETCVGTGARVVAGVAALSTAEAVDVAKSAVAAGCEGLMVLPPYVYRGSWAETRAHFEAVIGATELPCMLYNNPIAYGTDLAPDQVAELAARNKNVTAVKESSGDVRRITAIKRELGLDLTVLVGVDDLIVEGVAAGAEGWVAGLANALPQESVDLFHLALKTDPRAVPLYKWFLPLLRLDTVPQFVQLIKLVQQELGRGSERVRPPRQPLSGAERDTALLVIRRCLAERPQPSLTG